MRRTSFAVLAVCRLLAQLFESASEGLHVAQQFVEQVYGDGDGVVKGCHGLAPALSIARVIAGRVHLRWNTGQPGGSSSQSGGR